MKKLILACLFVAIATPAMAQGKRTPIQGNATGTTAAVIGTLAAVPGQTAYLCAFKVEVVGSSAVGPVTVAGLAGGPQVFPLVPTATGAVVGRQFKRCLPASAAATDITVTTTGNPAATAVTVKSWGFNR
jgi:hypothetical protein